MSGRRPSRAAAIALGLLVLLALIVSSVAVTTGTSGQPTPPTASRSQSVAPTTYPEGRSRPTSSPVEPTQPGVAVAPRGYATNHPFIDSKVETYDRWQYLPVAMVDGECKVLPGTSNIIPMDGLRLMLVLPVPADATICQFGIRKVSTDSKLKPALGTSQFEVDRLAKNEDQAVEELMVSLPFGTYDITQNDQPTGFRLINPR